MARSRSSSPTADENTASAFDATQCIWPTLQVAKELPRRRRRTVYKDARGGGASARTSTCPPLGHSRRSVTRRSSRSPSPRYSRQAREEVTPRTTRVLNEAPWRRRSSQEGTGKAVTLAEVEAVSEATVLAAEAAQEAREEKEVQEAQEAQEAALVDAKETPAPADAGPAEAAGVAEDAVETLLKPDDGGATGTEPEESKCTLNLRHSLAGKGCSTKKRTSFASRNSLAGFTPPNNFADWLDSRPAMLRLGTQSGMGWEFPLSRSEKRELLVLNLAAENRVQSMQLEIQNEHIEQLEEETVEA